MRKLRQKFFEPVCRMNRNTGYPYHSSLYEEWKPTIKVIAVIAAVTGLLVAASFLKSR